MNLNLENFFSDYLKGGGVNHSVTGPRGHGKTRTTVTIMQHCVEGKFPSLGKVEVLTNIVFSTRGKSGRLEIGHPPGVHYVTTFADMLRTAGQILQKYGIGNVTILMILDEAQNFMIADVNGSEENQAILKFMGNTRKLGMCTFLLTPTIKNLVPKIRNFDTDDNPGYCGVRWSKQKQTAAQLVRTSGMNINPDHIVWIQLSSAEEPVPYVLPYSSWANTREESLKTGQYAYDTLSAADFSMGVNAYDKKFVLKDFLAAVSKVRSKDIPSAIERYFAYWDNLGDEEQAAGVLKEMFEMRRMREIGLTFKQLGYIKGANESTVKMRYYAYFPPEKSKSSKPATRQNEVPTPEYIEPILEGERGAGAPADFVAELGKEILMTSTGNGGGQ